MGRILAERIKPEVETSASGLIVSLGDKTLTPRQGANAGDQIVEKSLEALPDIRKMKVIEVGPQVGPHTGIVKDAIILTNKYAGIDVFMDTEVFLINEIDVLAILE